MESKREGQTAEEDELLVAAQLLSEHFMLPQQNSSMGLYASLSIPAIMGYYYEIRLYYPKYFLNSLLILLGMSFR